MTGTVLEPTVAGVAEAVARSQCVAASVRFFNALDGRDYDGVLDAMTPDGVWVRAGSPTRGRSEIRKALEARPETVDTCHVLANEVVELHDQERASVRFRLLIYALDKTHEPALGELAQIRSCLDELVRADGQWRIAHKTSDLAMNLK